MPAFRIFPKEGRPFEVEADHFEEARQKVAQDVEVDKVRIIGACCRHKLKPVRGSQFAVPYCRLCGETK